MRTEQEIRARIAMLERYNDGYVQPITGVRVDQSIAELEWVLQ